IVGVLVFRHQSGERETARVIWGPDPTGHLPTAFMVSIDLPEAALSELPQAQRRIPTPAAEIRASLLPGIRVPITVLGGEAPHEQRRLTNDHLPDGPAAGRPGGTSPDLGTCSACCS